MSRRIASIGFIFFLWTPTHAFQAPSAAERTYKWVAEFVAVDPTAKMMTVKVRIPEYVSKYVDRFKPGDHVTLIWNMLPLEPSTTAGRSAATPVGPAKEGAKPSSSGTSAQQPAVPAPIVLKTERDVLMSIYSSDATKGAKIGSGYILPAEVVAMEAKTVTVKLRVPDHAVHAVASMQPGARLRATSSMSQPTDVAAVSAVTAVSNPEVGTPAR